MCGKAHRELDVEDDGLADHARFFAVPDVEAAGAEGVVLVVDAAGVLGRRRR